MVPYLRNGLLCYCCMYGNSLIMPTLFYAPTGMRLNEGSVTLSDGS